MRQSQFYQRKGFTLIELLVVIGVVALLSVIVVLALNPAEIIKRGRDSRRLAELRTLDKAIDLASTGNLASIGNPLTVYISIPDVSPVCANLGLPFLPPGWAYSCVAAADARRVDGNGWIPIDFTGFSGGTIIPSLPLDPLGNASEGLFYAYVTDGKSYAISVTLETEKYLREFAVPDGGTDYTRIEEGSNIPLWAKATGLVGFWRLDEGSGIAFADSSPEGNSGSGSGTWVTGKVDGGMHMASQFASIANGSSLEITGTQITLSAWVKPYSAGGAGWRSRIISKDADGDNDGSGDVYSFLFDNARRPLFRLDNVDLTATGAALTLNQWALLTAVYDGSVKKIYKNGILTSPTPAKSDAINGSSQEVYLGGHYDNGTPEFGSTIDGDLDEVRIYNRPLSVAEIAKYYLVTR